MILARLTQAIREQNWFAVTLELVIVILGVVIGFQFTAWNSERQTQADVSDLLARLHDEIIDVETVRVGWRDLVQPGLTLEMLQGVSPLLLGDAEPDRQLSDAECRAIVQSHILALPPQILPILDELEATGDIRLIADENIRRALTNQKQRFERTADLVAQMSLGNTALPSDFPAAFRFIAPEDPQNWNPIFVGSVRCDLSVMRADRAFLNRYADYVTRYLYYVETSVHSTDQRLGELHTAVDSALGINHEAAAE